VVTLPDLEASAAPPPASVKGGGGVPFPLVLLLLLGVAGGMFWMLRHRAPTVITKVTQAEPKPLPPPLPSAAEADDGAPEIEVALVLFPLDARVLLGDKDLGQMPVSVKVKDGHPVKLRIVRDGYWTRKLTVDGSKKRIVVGLVKRDASAKNNPEPEGDEEPSGALPRSVPTAQ
jgi:hypothetical protein